MMITITTSESKRVGIIKSYACMYRFISYSQSSDTDTVTAIFKQENSGTALL